MKGVNKIINWVVPIFVVITFVSFLFNSSLTVKITIIILIASKNSEVQRKVYNQNNLSNDDFHHVAYFLLSLNRFNSTVGRASVSII